MRRIQGKKTSRWYEISGWSETLPTLPAFHKMGWCEMSMRFNKATQQPKAERDETDDARAPTKSTTGAKLKISESSKLIL